MKELVNNQYCKDAISLKESIEIDYLTLGAMLSKIQEKRLWEAGWGSEDEFHMELKLSPATISKLIRIYQIFHLQYEIPKKQLAQAGGWSVVAEYLPMVTEKTTPKQVSGWLTGAAEMTRADIRRTIHEATNGTDMAACKHKNGYKLFVCPDCGERHRI